MSDTSAPQSVAGILSAPCRDDGRMSNTPLNIALLSQQSLPAVTASGDVPEWVHLLPAGQAATFDDRGPYVVGDMAAVITASLAQGDKLPIDQDHATDLAAPNGQPAPARGWIVELQQRGTGLWGRVEWTETGRALLADRAYRGISPVITHDDENNVLALLRASLVNRPNLRGLTALHSQKSQQMETGMTLLETMAKALGLDATASEADVIAAFQAKMGAGADEAMQSTLNEIGAALGVADGDAAAVLNAAKAVGSDAKTLVPALQSQIATLTTDLATLKKDGQRRQSEQFIDGAIAEMRIGLNSENRDEFVALHMENPERTEKLVAGFPCMSGDGATKKAIQATSLQGATTNDVVAKAKAYQAKMATAGDPVSFTVACLAVQEGKE